MEDYKNLVLQKWRQTRSTVFLFWFSPRLMKHTVSVSHVLVVCVTVLPSHCSLSSYFVPSHHSPSLCQAIRTWW